MGRQGVWHLSGHMQIGDAVVGTPNREGYGSTTHCILNCNIYNISAFPTNNFPSVDLFGSFNKQLIPTQSTMDAHHIPSHSRLVCYIPPPHMHASLCVEYPTHMLCFSGFSVC